MTSSANEREQRESSKERKEKAKSPSPSPARGARRYFDNEKHLERTVEGLKIERMDASSRHSSYSGYSRQSRISRVARKPRNAILAVLGFVRADAQGDAEARTNFAAALLLLGGSYRFADNCHNYIRNIVLRFRGEFEHSAIGIASEFRAAHHKIFICVIGVERNRKSIDFLSEKRGGRFAVNQIGKTVCVYSYRDFRVMLLHKCGGGKKSIKPLRRLAIPAKYYFFIERPIPFFKAFDDFIERRFALEPKAIRTIYARAILS